MRKLKVFKQNISCIISLMPVFDDEEFSIFSLPFYFYLFFQFLIYISIILNFIFNLQRILFLNLHTVKVIHLMGNC